jgi:hypothetical protein
VSNEAEDVLHILFRVGVPLSAVVVPFGISGMYGGYADRCTESIQVSLAVMEETGIAVVVHKLKGHRHPRISHMAFTICAAWQTLATRATNLASLALDVQKSQLQVSKAVEPAAACARVLLPRDG